MIENDIFGLERENKIIKSGVRNIFTPHQPIHDLKLFLGRKSEVKQLIGYLNTPGQHALIFGDRGVGKSSIANITSELLLSQVMGHRIVKKRCDSEDNFVTIVRKILEEVNIDIYQGLEEKRRGFQAGKYLTFSKNRSSTFEGYSGKAASPSWVCEEIQDIDAIYVIDEIDSIKNNYDRKKIAELIKQLSDSGSSLKVLLVGISETASDLVAGHKSVNRCLKEVKINKMSDQEIRSIITSGSEKLGLSFTKKAISNIVSLSSGYPHFTHLLCLKSAEEAIVNEQKKVDSKNLTNAISSAVDDAEGTLRADYNNAVRSSQSPEYKKILLVASLCEDEEIKAKDIRIKYEEEFDEKISQGTLNNYYKRLVSDDDSSILKRIAKGVYKFNDPRMPSYIQIAQSYFDRD